MYTYFSALLFDIDTYVNLVSNTTFWNAPYALHRLHKSDWAGWSMLSHQNQLSIVELLTYLPSKTGLCGTALCHNGH